jgi:hypothetical protein
MTTSFYSVEPYDFLQKQFPLDYISRIKLAARVEQQRPSGWKAPR